MKKAFALLMYPQGGIIVSSVMSGNGIGYIGQLLTTELGVIVRMGTYDCFLEGAAHIKERPADEIIIIGGTSLGACNSPWMAAAAYPRKVSYMFCIQPSMWGQRHDIPANVVEARLITSPFWMTMGYGSRTIVPQAGNTTTKIVRQTTYHPHPGDNFKDVRNPILSDVQRILKQ